MKPIADRLREYLRNMESRNYSASTVVLHKRGLEQFIHACDVRSCEDLLPERVRRYERWLIDRGVCDNTRITRLCAVRSFLQFLRARNLILLSDAAMPRIPKKTRHLPRSILTEEEMEALLHLPVLTSVEGVRLRAYLEILYGTGVRRMELVNLDVYDLDMRERTLFVRDGKGGKDRVIPVAKTTARYVGEYIKRSRRRQSGRGQALFLSRHDRRIEARNLDKSIHYLKEKARERLGIDKPISCHVFRHSIATHLIQRGVDIRYVQAFLGHSQLSSTQIYTHIVKEHAAREILRRHPREKMKIPLR